MKPSRRKLLYAAVIVLALGLAAMLRPRPTVVESGRVLGYFLGQANVGLGASVNRFMSDLAGRRTRLARRQTLAGAAGTYFGC